MKMTTSLSRQINSLKKLSINFIAPKQTRSYQLKSIKEQYPQVESFTTNSPNLIQLIPKGTTIKELPDIDVNDLVIIPNFISSEEHDALVKVVDKKMKRIRSYEEEHLDNVIKGYKECQISDWQGYSQLAHHTLQRFEALFKEDTVRWLPAHILELSDKGGIKHHVDNIELSGNIIAGICLLAPTVLQFRHNKHPDMGFDVLAPERCLYIQRNSVRFNFTHAIPSDPSDHLFKSLPIPKERRIALLFRDVKSHTNLPNLSSS